MKKTNSHKPSFETRLPNKLIKAWQNTVIQIARMKGMDKDASEKDKLSYVIRSFDVNAYSYAFVKAGIKYVQNDAVYQQVLSQAVASYPPTVQQQILGGMDYFLRAAAQGEFRKAVLGPAYTENPGAYVSSPGKVEAFGIAVFNFLVPELQNGTKSISEAQMILPQMPSVADIMSIWEQENRSSAQWDGNIINKLIRNLGAEVGVVGNPAAVNFQNAVDTTGFVDKLPAPVYPFDVNLKKAFFGEIVYEYACASCHESEQFMSVDAVGTDPGRALGLSAIGREYLLAGLKAACPIGADPRCEDEDENILVPLHDNPGYTALPLSGLWARAPYLHNGSVPTMYELLVPSARRSVFHTGNLNYDQENMGFVSSEGGNGIYDTALSGFSNQGHSDRWIFNGGIDFEKSDFAREALIEYLKTR